MRYPATNLHSATPKLCPSWRLNAQTDYVEFVPELTKRSIRTADSCPIYDLRLNALAWVPEANYAKTHSPVSGNADGGNCVGDPGGHRWTHIVIKRRKQGLWRRSLSRRRFARRSVRFFSGSE